MKANVNKSQGKKAVKPPTQKQWEALYDVAQNLKMLAPWKNMWDTELFTLILPGREEPVYCSVIGRNGECFGIGVYPGYASILKFHYMAESSANDPATLSVFEQDCLMFNIGNRDELEAQDMDVLKKLNLKYRGKNQWIYFRSIKPGHLPWFITAEEANLLIDALQNFAMAYLFFLEKGSAVDFDKGETIVRMYVSEEDCWKNGIAPALPIPVPNMMISITDEVMIARLKKQKKTQAQLEIDFFYLPAPIQEHKSHVPYLPVMIALADRNTGIALAQKMLRQEEDVDEIFLNMLFEHILKNGRPAKIYVRGERKAVYLIDLCAKIGIKLVADEEMIAINNFFNNLMDFLD